MGWNPPLALTVGAGKGFLGLMVGDGADSGPSRCLGSGQGVHGSNRTPRTLLGSGEVEWGGVWTWASNPAPCALLESRGAAGGSWWVLGTNPGPRTLLGSGGAWNGVGLGVETNASPSLGEWRWWRGL